jgi:hypothetical protein
MKSSARYEKFTKQNEHITAIAIFFCFCHVERLIKKIRLICRKLLVGIPDFEKLRTWRANEKSGRKNANKSTASLEKMHF